MKNLEENAASVYTNTAEVSALKEQQSGVLGRSWIFSLITSLLFIFCSVFIYQKFLKDSDNTTFSKAIDSAAPRIFTEKITIEKGETIGKILSSYDLSYQKINKILKASSSQKINLTQLKPGQVLEIQYVKDKSQKKTLKYLTANINHKAKLKIAMDPKTNSFQGSIVPIDLVKEVISFGGKIKNSLMVSAIHQGVPVSNLIEATNASSYEIDFQRDLRNGDSFKILLEKFTSKEDGSTFFGKTLYFSLNLSRKKYRIYKFKPKNGQEEFFTEKHRSAKRGLLKTPVPVFRISGRFGMRKKHPILGYSVMHKGVDFAAPLGTSIYAAGDGVISTIGRNKGYGKFIKIRHNGRLTTVYGHISRFAKKLKRGARVKQGQIIAFVGQTGRATGPHLHYEIRVNGRHVNPLKFKLPSVKILKGQDMEKFKTHKSYIDSLLGSELFA